MEAEQSRPLAVVAENHELASAAESLDRTEASVEALALKAGHREMAEPGSAKEERR